MSANTPEATTPAVLPGDAAAPIRRGNLLSKTIRDVTALPGFLSAENLGFSTWALMLFVALSPSPPAIARMAAEMNLSYWALRNQILRTPYFETIEPTGDQPLVCVALTQDALTKLERMAKRLNQ